MTDIISWSDRFLHGLLVDDSVLLFYNLRDVDRVRFFETFDNVLEHDNLADVADFTPLVFRDGTVIFICTR